MTTETARKVTAIVCVGVFIALNVYNVWIASQAPGATISSVMVDTSLQAPLLPFVAGFICGHWFWPQRR